MRKSVNISNEDTVKVSNEDTVKVSNNDTVKISDEDRVKVSNVDTVKEVQGSLKSNTECNTENPTKHCKSTKLS